MSHEEYRKIMEEIKRYQFSVDVPELTDSEPGIEQMEVISINDMFNILNEHIEMKNINKSERGVNCDVFLSISPRGRKGTIQGRGKTGND